MDSVNPQIPALPLAPGLGIKLYRYRTLIRRHWWVLLLTVGLGLAYEAYVVFTKPPQFESHSELIVREELIADPTGMFQDKSGMAYQTAVEQLKSQIVLDRAQRRLALEAPDLRGSVDITPAQVPRTNIFTISGIGTQPMHTQKFVDAVVAEFLAVRQEQRVLTGNQFLGGLSGQIAEEEKTLEKQKASLQAFIEKNNMQFWAEQGKSSAIYLSGLKNHQAQLQNELQRLEVLTPDQLLATPPAQTPAPKITPGQVSVAPAQQQEVPFNQELYVQYLAKTQDLSQKQSELDEWKTIWKPKHPKLIAIQKQVDDLHRAIDVIKQQNISATKSRVAAIKGELKSLDTSIQTWEQKVLEASRKDAEYQTLQSDVARTQSVLEKWKTDAVSIKGPGKSSQEPLVVTRGATTAEPVAPRTMQHLLIGLFGGLVVGGIILLLLDRADDRVSSSTEMIEHFSESILGQIPNVADTRKESGLPLLQEEDERYTYAEAFRSLRSSLIFMPNQTELKTLLITSAIPNEGKSTISGNLAVTMAAAGARVLLVDADLRRGDLAELFDVDGRVGLSNILRGDASWKSVVCSTKYPTLSLIPRGPVTNQSGELLLKPQLVALLDEFRHAYDLVIFNTAPILAADDTPTLAPNFDGGLMVVRAQFTSARLVKNALNALYQRQVNVLGLILNCVDTEMPDYYYYRYPKYYAA
jgi:capsular exopolysaccharide synthesis family protein